MPRFLTTQSALCVAVTLVALALPLVSGGVAPSDPPRPVYLRHGAGDDPVIHKDIKVAHVVFMNHLDVGFDGIDPIEGFARNVMNKYFDEYYPAAIAVSERLRKEGREERLVYNTHSWVASMYLDCPAGMGLHCPSDARKAEFVEAVRRGDITWHAFPFNSEPEMLDPGMAHFALEMTHAMDDQYGRKRSAVMSQRDVPGMTRGIIPVLAAHKVIGVSVGVNGGSMPPGVPPVFVWEDEQSGESVLATWHPGDYGGEFTVPGFDRALVFMFRPDNAGPQGYDEVLSDWADIRKRYPNARIHAGPIDDFYFELQRVRHVLPVVRGEIGDTWIYGVPSDPLKNSLVRVLQRERAAYLASPSPVVDVAFGNFSRLLLKASEHTWGGDVKTFLDASHKPLYYQWSNPAFEKARGAVEYRHLEDTWREQRDWALGYAVEALEVGRHPLFARASAAVDEFKRAQRTAAPLDGYEALGPDEVRGRAFAVGGGAEVRFDHRTGAVVSWSGRGFAFEGPGALFGEMLYQTFTEGDYDEFHAQYAWIPVTVNPWVHFDFGKKNVTNADPEHIEAAPALRRLHHKDGSFVAELAFDDHLVTKYGAPRRAWLEYRLDAPARKMHITARIHQKTTTRLPESLWVRFRPGMGGETEDTTQFEMTKIGSVVRHDEVHMNGSFHLHAVSENGGVAIPYPKDSLTLRITSPDVPVLSLGAPLSPFPTPQGVVPRVEDGLAFNLVNNIWGTNYVMWYPFDDSDDWSMFRFTVSVEEN